MSDKEVEIDWCPTMSGNYFAYYPEWKTPTGDWKDIETKTGINPVGVNVPLTKHLGGLSETIGLLGYEAAMCLAWGFAAQAAAMGDKIEVRVQEYEIVYDIKARKVDSDKEHEHEPIK